MTAEPLALSDPGAALLEAVAHALPDLEGLAAHADVLGPTELARTIASTRERLRREQPHVVVVGEQKSGKSTFLNALLGTRLLGTAARECTATVTRLRWGEPYDYVATFENGEVQRFSEKLPDPAGGYAEAIAALERAREALSAARGPLSELPPPSPLEPPLAPAQQEALVDAYRALGSARSDREAAKEAIPAGGNWLTRLLSLPRHRYATAQLAQEEVRHEEAERGVAQAQGFVVDRRLAALQEQLALRRRARDDAFAAAVKELTDAAGRGADVVSLDLTYPGRFLPRGLVLIDTPGVNTEHERHRERAWRVIREEADGCWLVSDMQQALSRSTREFLQALRPFVAHAFLVLTKVDRALANAEGDGDAAEQVEEARRIAVKRFAKELDRRPQEVLAVAVASEKALDEPASALGQDFARGVETLLALAKQERAIVLGARAAGGVKRGIAAIDAALKGARLAYEQRLALLEEQRIPQPEAFCAEQLAQVRARLATRLPPLVADAVLEAKKALARQQTSWHVQLLTAVDEAELRAKAAKAGEEEAALVGRILESSLSALRAGAGSAMAELEAPALEGVRRRYRLVQELTGPTGNLPVLASAQPATDAALGAAFDDTLATYTLERMQLGLGGAAAGAALGSMVMPGVGTVVGALVGSLAAFFISLDDLKDDCIKQLEARTAALEPKLVAAIEQAAAAIQDGLLQTLSLTLQEALRHFDAWITQLLDAEREAISRLEAALADLKARQTALAEHEALLGRLLKDAEEASQGLARSPG